ncbi:hypothetical protein BH20VER3_BH20VER3_21890 [soil metagenome]
MTFLAEDTLVYCRQLTRGQSGANNFRADAGWVAEGDTDAFGHARQ